MEEIKTLQEYNQSLQRLDDLRLIIDGLKRESHPSVSTYGQILKSHIQEAYCLSIALFNWEALHPPKPEPIFTLQDMERAFDEREYRYFDSWIKNNYPNL